MMLTRQSRQKQVVAAEVMVIVHVPDLVGHAGVEKDALGGRSLARINVGHDADVSRVFERILPRHDHTP
jgi:hypothetical protein